MLTRLRKLEPHLTHIEPSPTFPYLFSLAYPFPSRLIARGPTRRLCGQAFRSGSSSAAFLSDGGGISEVAGFQENACLLLQTRPLLTRPSLPPDRKAAPAATPAHHGNTLCYMPCSIHIISYDVMHALYIWRAHATILYHSTYKGK